MKTRTIKLYGPLRDPKAEAKRQRSIRVPLRKPHAAEVITSVKPRIHGQIL